MFGLNSFFSGLHLGSYFIFYFILWLLVLLYSQFSGAEWVENYILQQKCTLQRNHYITLKNCKTIKDEIQNVLDQAINTPDRRVKNTFGAFGLVGCQSWQHCSNQLFCKISWVGGRSVLVSVLYKKHAARFSTTNFMSIFGARNVFVHAFNYVV